MELLKLTFILLLYSGSIGEYRTEPVGPPCLPYSIYYHRQNATILEVHRLKFLGTRIAYYGNATATFQLDILVCGDISSNPGPDCSANNDIVDLHTYSRITYKSEELMKMNQSSSPISTLILNHIKLLGITPPRRTHRGTRGGRRKTKKHDLQPVKIFSETSQPISSSSELSSHIASPDPPTCSASQERRLRIGAWNAQSIVSKTDLLCDLILENEFDIICVTETWLYEKSTAVIGEATPPGYVFLNFPRGTRGGGIAVIYKQNLKLKHKTLYKTDSFEHAVIHVSNSSQALNVVVVYRPDPSGENTSAFMTEFEPFLGAVDLLCGRTLLLGDFNLHMNRPSKYEVKLFNEILITLEYRQLVNVPTHRLGNTLDLLIVKESDDLVGEWDVNPIFYSDHLIVSSVLDMAGVGASRTLSILRNFKNIDHNAFASDLKTKLDLVLLDSQSCVDDLVVAYNSVCQSVLDAHAPARVKSRSVRLKPKWYNEAVVNARRLRRQSERRWRKTRSDADYQKYLDAKRAASDSIALEKSRFYADKFDNCNAKDMYRTVNELLNVNSNNLPDCESTVELANNFSDYFLGKVDKIRQELDANASATSNLNTYNNYDSDIMCRLSQFQLVTEDTLHEVIMKCPSKSCSLDPMPTWLVKQHLSVLTPILTKIVNSSLSSGSFPSGLRRAIITPILKKASLDKILWAIIVLSPIYLLLAS